MSGTRRLGLLRLRRGGEDPWASWWYFKGPSGYGDGDNAHLWMDDNADFEIDNGICTVLVGAEPATGVWTSGRYSSLFSKEYYPPIGSTGSWGLAINYRGDDPSLLARDCHWAVWRGGFGRQNNYVGNFLYPFEKTIFGGRFRGSDSASWRSIHDSSQSLNQYNWFYGSSTDDSTTRVRIAARGDNSSPDYSDQHFRGKIYWALWVKGYLVGHSQLQDVWDGTILPYEVCDPGTYPMCYIDFKDAVGSTLTPDIQSGPNAPYTFNVYGTPVLNGP